ncbi:Crp/Fnr family transcriptional regulator [Rhabdaerophilum sp. SD176]|uniref:Crp/Fnr family transcriptional regulator n=1 Tax=Rhabdaerophilum sp. SD176 TaxID=2983548 RepID=UPI0024E02E0F|nr:Crp/Fnr family transcriptional regulator [Rhabdaerophilum sp. SD176]
MRLDDLILLLRDLPVFESVDPEALRLLAFSAIRRHLRTGDILFRRGDPADGGFLVVSGEIVLDRSDDGAPSPHVFGPGSLIGQLALVAPLQRPATAVVRDGATVMYFSRELMTKVLEAHPESALAMRNYLARQTRQLADRLARVTGL